MVISAGVVLCCGEVAVSAAFGFCWEEALGRGLAPLGCWVSGRLVLSWGESFQIPRHLYLFNTLARISSLVLDTSSSELLALLIILCLRLDLRPRNAQRAAANL